MGGSSCGSTLDNESSKRNKGTNMVGIYENELPQMVQNENGKLGKWLYVKECSEWIGVSERTIYQYLREGRLRGIKARGRRLISVGSILWFQIEQKALEIKDIKNKETAREVLNYKRSIKN